VIPRHIKILLLLLPLFIARSMLPIGFMLSFEAGMPRLVLCPSQVSIPAQPASAAQHSDHDAHLAHHGHEHHHADEQTEAEHVGQSHQTCPFAFAAAAPLSAAVLFVAEPPPSEAISSPHERVLPQVAVRAHPIRGPPALS
jgi:hypothetical protein